ncbi:MAG: uracil phosphoribosyltransferase [Bacteroidota bacterium]
MFVLNNGDSIANHFIAELRDVERQKDRMRFRKNLYRIGQLLAYEISKSMRYVPVSVETPLGKANTVLLEHQPVLIPILRAAIPFFDGFLDFFDGADAGFAAAYRIEEAGEGIDVYLGYLAANDLTDKEVILIDPMIATGKSLVKTINRLRENGDPAHLHLASVIAAPEGINYISENLDLKYSVWTGALDESLNDKAYIVPGLGDAGDLSYGSKI